MPRDVLTVHMHMVQYNIERYGIIWHKMNVIPRMHNRVHWQGTEEVD